MKKNTKAILVISCLLNLNGCGTCPTLEIINELDCWKEVLWLKCEMSRSFWETCPYEKCTETQ